MSDTEIARNHLPYGAALNVSSARGHPITLKNNRISDNDLSQGVPSVLIIPPSAATTLPVDIQGNLVAGADGGEETNLVLSTNGPLVGTIGCNTFIGGSLGFNLRGETRQVPGFALAVYANVLDSHTPPIIPFYLQYGIGRGAASEVALDMRGNWWGDPSGPMNQTSIPSTKGMRWVKTLPTLNGYPPGQRVRRTNSLEVFILLVWRTCDSTANHRVSIRPRV